ncbi:C2H2 zinc finger protein [Histoplasma capsulatum H143]|uniref:C2H2 zinc finger protein n=1 Tax=Ajellomyces capsulatus (strain H143) TaxID=544712 RepID=C6HAD5_AJECH|nr:C2H2 zinc finger protein [Histoplasma capsulatum H143]
MMMPDVYDSDDACNASPRLEPTKIDCRPRATPPPFLQEPDSPGKASPGGRDRKDPRRRRKKTQPAHSDLLILSSLATPQLAYELGQKSLPTDSLSESSSPDDYRAVDERGRAQDISMPDIITSSARQTAQHALDLIIADDTPAEPQRSGAKIERTFGEELRAPSRPPNFLEPQAPPQHLQCPMVASPMDKDIAKCPFVKKLPISIPESHPRLRVNESLATSPTLRKYTISTSDYAAGETLPALQSRPEPTSAKPPENSQNLPSIEDALSGHLGPINSVPHLYSPGAVPAPSQPRNIQEHPPRRPSEQYIPPPLTTTPSSFLSPESSRDMSASLSPVACQPQHSYWQQTMDKGMSYSHSPGDHGSQFTSSPSTGYPTPVELGKSGSYDSPPIHPSGHTSSNGPLNSSGFKCNYPDCKAEPFQTQYLLNSHANVHSQNRPYYCPVKGCPRGEGGKGFKRKNEMKRHGLVHDSPGYVCPFCPDQQHTYPRPDNLQRHVRVHHVDKDREDPELRQVLAQRPEGGMRGRRRRNGAR